MPSKLQLLVSVLIHATIAVAWFGPAQLWQSLPFQEHVSGSPAKQNGGTRFVTEHRHDEPEKRPQPKVASKADMPPVEQGKESAEPSRRDYAGAPPASQAPQPIKELAPPSAIATRAPGTLLVSPEQATENALAAVTLTPAPDQKRLMAADQPRAEGDQVPIIDAIGLTSDGIDGIVGAGFGLLLVECDSQVGGSGVQRYVVKGGVRSPTGLIPVAVHELHGYSERALRLPSTECASVRKQLKADYAIADPQLSRCRCLLLFTNGFDQTIYAAQCQAASTVGASLDDLAVTTGRFEQAGANVAFSVIAVTRHDGKRLALLQ
jgi:hypothetical protein